MKFSFFIVGVKGEERIFRNISEWKGRPKTKLNLFQSSTTSGMDTKEFFCFPAQIAHLPIGKEIPRKMIFINIIHHLLNPFI